MQKVTLVTKKDLDISYFAGSGKGGQAKNKVKSGVKITHRPSGAQGQASDSRSLPENKALTFKRMHETVKFKINNFNLKGYDYESEHITVIDLKLLLKV